MRYQYCTWRLYKVWVDSSMYKFLSGILCLVWTWPWEKKLALNLEVRVFGRPVELARGQRFRKMLTGVCWVSDNLVGSVEVAWGGNLLPAGQWAASAFFFSWFNYSLRGFFVCSGAACIPYWDAVCECALNCWPIEGHQELVVHPEHSQEVRDSGILGYEDSQESKGLYPFNRWPIYTEPGRVCVPLNPKVWYDLFGLWGVQFNVVQWTPHQQSLYLLPLRWTQRQLCHQQI